jgi:hypothetical protein
MLKFFPVTACAFLVSSLSLISTLPSVAEVPPANCSSALRSGRTLNWITMDNGVPVNRGILTISSVPEAGRWSGRQVNHTVGNVVVDLGGQFENSTMTMMVGSYNETWKGSCHITGIGGQINNNPNITFIMW